MENLDRLAAALLAEAPAVMARWRVRVRELSSARALDLPTLNDHMPVWLAELAQALQVAAGGGASEGEGEAESPLAHGLQRYEDGFDIEEVVCEYSILRDCVHELAERSCIDLRGRARREVDRRFDDAIAGAVRAFAESQAREVQRRRAEHLAFVAHDLRTPLSAITFCVHILEQRAPSGGGDAETARVLRSLGRGARQLARLVDQVLEENTQELTELGVKVERRSFDLWPMVELLLQDLQPIAAKAATSLVNQVPAELEVRADAGLLRRILQNLLANAIGYTPAGEVTVGARELPAQGQVECWVSDNGAGIPAHLIDKVFEVLATDPAREGTGLGLAIVKTFVEAHGGTVRVESVEGLGSTFRFTLPLTVAPAAADGPSGRTADVAEAAAEVEAAPPGR